jgi:hypothetical protein
MYAYITYSTFNRDVIWIVKLGPAFKIQFFTAIELTAVFAQIAGDRVVATSRQGS